MTDADPDSLAGADDLERDGFHQLFLLPVTFSDVWKVWPAEHHTTLPETRDAFWWREQSRSSGPVCHLIRSPWPSIPLQAVLSVMRVRLVQHRDWEVNEERAVEAARGVLSWDESRVLEEVDVLRSQGSAGL